MRRFLLGTAAAALAATALGPARAAEVLPGGALDLTVSLEAYLIASLGDTDGALLDGDATEGLDFFTDNEVAFVLEGERDGVGYGGVVTFQADTNAAENTDESWLFLRREGWGEVRLGDVEGVSSFSAGIVAGEDGAALSAASVAAGTGGLDGYVVSDLFGASTYEPLGTDNATKLAYASPKLGGLNVAVSYAPNLAVTGDGEGNGDSLAGRDVAAGDVVEAILHYAGELGGVGLLGSLSGLRGRVGDEDEAGGDDYWAVQAGAVVEVLGLSLAASYLAQEVGSLEVDAVTFGVGVALGDDEAEAGGANLSLNYGRIVRSDGLIAGAGDGVELDEPQVLVLSADYGLLPGLVLQGDLAWFDNDPKGDGGTAADEDGWFGVAALALAF